MAAMVAIVAILKIYFRFPSEPKGQFISNLKELIRVTCRSKIAKIVLIKNQRWLPWQPSRKSILRAISPEPKGLLARNLVGSIGVTCR